MKHLAKLMICTFLLFSATVSAADYEPADALFLKNADNLKLANKAVKWALLDRGWTINAETETSIQAILTKPDEQISLTILITFDLTKAHIAYVTSRRTVERRGLDTTAVVALDQDRYHRWVDNLARDIPIFLERLRIILGRGAQQGAPGATVLATLRSARAAA